MQFASARNQVPFRTLTGQASEAVCSEDMWAQYTQPGWNWRLSACYADVVATRQWVPCSNTWIYTSPGLACGAPRTLTGLGAAFSDKKKPTRVLCPPSGAMTRRPRGPMDKASVYGAGDCRLESCRGRYASGVLTHLHMRSPSRHVLTVGPCTITRPAVAPPGTSPCAMLATCLTRDGCIHVLQDARDRDALHHQANS